MSFNKNYYFLNDYDGWQKFNGGIVPEGYECRSFVHCGLMIRKKIKMKRFFGMMPASEVKRSVTLVDSIGLRITIQAGEKGWTILYADSSSEFKDVEDTIENNFNKALETLKLRFPEVKECDDESIGEVAGEN